MAKSEEWYVDEHNITRRRSTKWEAFWGVFMCVNLLAVVAFIGIFIWAGFDIHERFDYVLMAQIPPIVMMVIRRGFL